LMGQLCRFIIPDSIADEITSSGVKILRSSLALQRQGAPR
jgi:hypothetical protein